MNERFLKAFEKLSNEIKNLRNDVNKLQTDFDKYKEENNPKKFAEIAREIDRYNIKDGKWYYGDEDTGVSATGPRGDPFTFDDLTPEQIVLLTGADGEKGDPFTFDDLTPEQIVLLTGADGVDGVDGKDGKNGKDGKDGKPGKDGKDGKDGETPELEIGNIKSVSTYDPAKVSLKKTGNKYIIDMDIPRGRPGSNGADGTNGNSALINGMNTLNIEAGTNISIDQQGDTLTINSTGGGGGGTSNYNELTNKPSINNVELKGNKSLNDLGIQPKGNYVTDSNYVHTDNNYTSEEKTKLSGLSNYDDTEIKQSISNLQTNKADRTEIPDVSDFITKSVNDLTNYYLKSQTYTKTEVNNLISAIEKATFEVVNTLPATGESNVIYLVPSSSPKTQNVKDEYIWVNSAWEQIGSTQVDLTGYATERWVNTQISDFLTETEISTLISTTLTGYAKTSDLPTKVSDLQNDSGFITGYTETDPTVPNHVKSITQANITSWNNKADSGDIPTALSDLTDDSTHRLVTDTEKTTWNGKADTSDIPKYYHGTCATAAATSLKVVECEDFVLEEGATISVTFTYAQTYNGSPQLNVNGTGAIVVQYKGGSAGIRYMWSAGEIIDFTYNGEYWVCHGRALATTTYYGLAKLSASAVSTSTSLALTPSVINATMENIVTGYDAYSTSATYEVGDRVRYSTYVYECITTIPTAESWTAAHWKTIDPLQTQIDTIDLNKLDKTSVKDTYSTSATDTYSCNYINGIIESGSNENGEYIKYADGTMICTSARRFENVAVTTAWGSLYDSPNLVLGSLPVEFINIPRVFITCHNITGQTSNACFIEWITGTTTSSWGSTAVARPTSGNANLAFCLLAIGKWK